CLTEMVRRGGKHWEGVLDTRLAQLTAQIAKDKHGAWRFGARRLAVLTALRRVQGKSDPLTILVEGKSHLECRLGYLPPIAANLTNLDPEKAVVQFEKGGDY